jgi:hypothetical protein
LIAEILSRPRISPARATDILSSEIKNRSTASRAARWGSGPRASTTASGNSRFMLTFVSYTEHCLLTLAANQTPARLPLPPCPAMAHGPIEHSADGQALAQVLLSLPPAVDALVGYVRRKVIAYCRALHRARMRGSSSTLTCRSRSCSPNLYEGSGQKPFPLPMCEPTLRRKI